MARVAVAGSDLMERVESLRLVLDHVHANVFVADPNFELVYMNAAAKRTTKQLEGDLQEEYGLRVADLLFGSIHRFHRDPAKIDWESVGAEVVIESTGLFTKREDASKHLRGTVKKVVISAPATRPAVVSMTLFRRKIFRSRYPADGGRASTTSSFRYRCRSRAKPLAVS